MSNRAINRVSAHIVLGLSLFVMFLVGGATILTNNLYCVDCHDGFANGVLRRLR